MRMLRLEARASPSHACGTPAVLGRFCAALVAAALALAACGGEDYVGEKDACSKLKGSSAGQIHASGEAPGAPRVALATRYEVIVPDLGTGGYVAFQATEAGKRAIYLDADLPTTVYAVGSQGASEAKESALGNESDACSQIKHVHEYDLAAGEYFVRIGPALEGGVPDSIGLVIE